MPRIRRLLAIVIASAWVHGTAASAADPGTNLSSVAPAEQSPVPVLPGLETQVEFWKNIFATYSTHQVVIHDALNLDRIYEVLDFQSLADSGFSDAEITAYAQDKVRKEKERIRAILMRLHQLATDPGELSPEEQKIWALFSEVKNPSKFLEAAAEDRVRGQTGLRERFAAGVEVSRRYLPEMEAIVRREGLPIELTRLPLVESCFNVRAYSKVGAAGIWQFMPATARLYMRVDRAVDERRDPVVSTRAAADYLRANYEGLGNWPLAITAYNHGRAGIANAVATVGSSDLVQIIQNYHGPAFKFASRNFYAEFLAALDVEKHFATYFGELYPVHPRRTESVVIPNHVPLKTVARASHAAVDTLADLNPALTHDVIAGKLRVPKGYHLRLPAGSAAGFKLRYASLSTQEKQPTPKVRLIAHRVKPGQTLSGIAKHYRTTVAAIRRRNNLRATHLHAGQSLMIPTT
ncbi:MAG: transglycosylase SLT domain-containing protein [Candidatus Binatia bacterium]